MIFQLKGRITDKTGLLIILDVHGVGYGIFAPMSTVLKLPAIGEEVLLYTHLIVREDAHLLYGFLEKKEKLLFCELIKISGFGAKLALSILSHLSVEQFFNVIMLQNLSQLTDIPGVGHKTAQRLMVEMQNNINNKKFIELLDLNNSNAIANTNMNNQEIINDAQEALISLGYKPKEAILAIKAVINNNKDNNSESLLKAALKNLSKVYYD